MKVAVVHVVGEFSGGSLNVDSDQFQRFFDDGTAPGRGSLGVGNGAGAGDHVKVDPFCNSTDSDGNRLQKIKPALFQRP